MENLHFSATKLLLKLLLIQIPIYSAAQFDSLSNFRYYDKRGINVFEPPKQPVSEADGFKLRIGAGVVQQFQALSHVNMADGKGADSLYSISPGFTTAMANLYLNVQLIKGIRLNIASYLSTRRHNEARIKDAYLQFDKLPVNSVFWEQFMKVITVKAGYMEINYGDAHFLRSDGGHVIYNPFAENYILDAFTTAIAGEIYLRKKSFFAMTGISNSIYVKSGIDKSWGELFRVRFSGSFFHKAKGNTLYNGDRAGSNYFMVMEKAGPGITYSGNAFSGRIDPGFTHKVDALQLNGLFKLIGFEVFVSYETARGRMAEESTRRHIQQFALDWTLRFGDNDNVFIGSRYNVVTGRLAGMENDVTIDRVAMAAGYFFTRNMLIKAEIVDQYYRDFPQGDHRKEGKFKGCVIQAVIAF